MAVFDVTEACGLLGKTVLVELVWLDEETGEPNDMWCCVNIVGVVLTLKGVYEHPHFLVMDFARPWPTPHEMFWDNIRTMRVLDARTKSRKDRRT